MPFKLTPPLAAALGCLAAHSAFASDAAFGEKIRPLFEQYCFDCHDSGKAKADVNLERFDSEASLWKEPKLWERVLVQLREHAMPPAKKRQPEDAQRATLADWLAHALEHPDENQLPRDPGRSLPRRLSRLEYNNTVRDLLGVDTHPADEFPPDGGGGGGFDNNAGTLFVPPVLLEKYLQTAGELVEAAKPGTLFRMQPDAGRDDRTAARENLSGFARRAFRRPVDSSAVDRILGVYDKSRARGESYEAAVKLAARGILVSPQFLFRVEPEQTGATEPYRVDDFSLAARLSYFLWSSMPDEELFQAAAAGKLHEPQTLEAQVRRMLKDPKARAFAENFASQWLRTKELRTVVSPAPDKFPQFTPALRDAFYQESVEFFYGLMRDNQPLTDCLDCDYTYANATLAKFYGIPGVEGDAMRRVALTDRNRGGILGMGGVLALTSYPRRTSPVLRGKWVMEEILGTPPPPPPPSVNTRLGNEKPQDGLTFRQRLEKHREDPKCAGCHARMDPLGFGLENFDAIGAWRTEIGGVAVDASGQLITGQKFIGPAEMKRLLMERKEEFVRNVAEKMLAYALGRGLESADWWPVRRLAKAAEEDGCRTQTLIMGIVQSFPFQYRRPASGQPVAQNPQ